MVKMLFCVQLHPLFRLVCLLLFAQAFFPSPLDARLQEGEASKRYKNIAIGKPYVLKPAQDHPDPLISNSASGLTDGRHATEYFFSDSAAIGQKSSHTWVITIDLLRIKTIKGASFSTAAGAEGVEWPRSIRLLVSDDDKRYYDAGDLSALSSRHGFPPDSGYAKHRFWTRDLKTYGRFITFVVSSRSSIYADEVEVYGEDDGGAGSFSRGNPIEDLKAFFREKRIEEGIRVRLQKDIQEIWLAVTESALADREKKRILDRLQAIRQDLVRFAHRNESHFRSVFPLNRLHRQIFRVQAMFWRLEGCPALSLWQSGPWDPLSRMQIPPNSPEASLDIKMMSNEYRAGAINVSNASREDVELRLKIEGLPGSPNPSYIDVREVLWTDSWDGLPVASALSEVKRSTDALLISVPSGMTKQVWFTFHPTNLGPGKYEGRIVLTRSSSDFQSLLAPLTLQIFPIRFPDRPSLHLGGWDYTNRVGTHGVAISNREKIVAHLREHFVDSPWATSSVWPSGTFNEYGGFESRPDASNLDEWLKLWPDARQYCIAMGVKDQFAGSKMGSPEFEKKVGIWIAFWAEQITKRGLRPEQFHLLLVDEPRRAQQDEIIKQWAKAIRSAKTGIRIWEDPIHEDPYQADQEMMGLCDVLSPNRWFLMSEPRQREYYTQRREQGSELALYSCFGPMQQMDPYLYCRLQAWSCWEYGAKGSYFWSFADNGGGSSWNEYVRMRKGYTPFFLDETSVTSGKHMEAIREGIEDYEYLKMLKEAISCAESKVGSDAVPDRARKLLDEAAGRVMNTEERLSYMWRDKKDRSIADRVRIEILETLVELQDSTVKE